MYLCITACSMNCNDFIAFFSFFFSFFNIPVFLKGVLGYRSVVHLENVILSSVHQTQPTKQHKTPSLLPQFQVLRLFHWSSRAGSVTWGCQKGKFARRTPSHEGWPRKVRAQSNFGAWKCTSRYTPCPYAEGLVCLRTRKRHSPRGIVLRRAEHCAARAAALLPTARTYS